MKLTLLYFAAVRDLTGTAEEDVDVDVATIAELARWLERERPALRERLAHVRFARNEEFAAAATALAEGDVIALIPPVAGG